MLELLILEFCRYFYMFNKQIILKKLFKTIYNIFLKKNHSLNTLNMKSFENHS